MSGHDRDSVTRRAFVKAVGVAGAASGMAAVGGATPGRSPGPKPEEVLVGVSQAAGTPADVVRGYTPDHAEVVHENRALGYAAVAFGDDAPADAAEKFADAVENRPGVKYAEFNATHEALFTPNDPEFDRQYAPSQVDSDRAWDTTLGDSSVRIAVVDTGVQYDHPDLSGNFGSDTGRDFVDDDQDPYPDVASDEYHGTHVSGCAAAVVDNGTGVAGQGNSTLISGRALDETGSGSTSDIADAVEWAADQGAAVINLSLGGGGYTSTMKNAVSYAVDNGALPVAAAGNGGTSSVSYPAAYSECVAVSAVDSAEQLASFSNYGSEVELCAPGVDVLSTTTEARGSYETLSGTSMATPVVAGVAGLTLARWNLTDSELRNHLKNTAEDVGLAAEKQGSGQADAYAAVTTDPSGGDGGGGGGGSTSGSVSDSLTGYADYDCWEWNWNYGDPSQVVVELDGPSTADFDLYVSTDETDCPGPNDYDYASYSTDSQESVTVDAPLTTTALQVSVDSYDGSGDYTLTVTEYE